MSLSLTTRCQASSDRKPIATGRTTFAQRSMRSARAAASRASKDVELGGPSKGSGAAEEQQVSDLTSRVQSALAVSGGSSVAQGSTVPNDGRTSRGATERADSGGMTRMESMSSAGSQAAEAAPGVASARLPSPAPGDARPSVTPQLGVNPRQDKRAAGADSEAQGLGVRGNVESMGATTGGVALEDVVWHASDMIVKPIVGNRRIERVPEPKWDAGSLPFKPLSLHDLLGTTETPLNELPAADLCPGSKALAAINDSKR